MCGKPRKDAESRERVAESRLKVCGKPLEVALSCGGNATFPVSLDVT